MKDLFTLDRKGENNGGQVLWSDDQLTYLVEEYNKNHSIPTLANQFKISPQAIRDALRRQGVKILSLSELHKLDYPRNSSYFHVIDTPEKAYWLGMLYADGTLDGKKRITLGLKSSDEEHVQNFLNAIGAVNHKIVHATKIDGDKTFTMSVGTIRDEEMENDLIDKGCFANKTFTIKFPYDKMPEELYSHFIRGYFDGDGSLYYTQSGRAKRPNWRIGFTCGSYDFLIELRKLLGKDNVAIENRGTFGSLQIAGNKQLVGILEYIYKDSTETTCLKRKRQIYDKFLLQS